MIGRLAFMRAFYRGFAADRRVCWERNRLALAPRGPGDDNRSRTNEPMTSHSNNLSDPSPEELRRLGHAAVELMVEALAAERTDPVLPAVTGEDLRARFDGPPPLDGAPVEAVLAELREHLVPAHRKNGHPRFFGYVCASADPIGAIFDGLASFFNQNVTAWRSGPGATAMERLVVRWLDELVGFGGGGQGLLVSGGSAANATAIAMALRSAAGRSGASLADSLPCITAYVSTEGHLSLGKALRAFGVGGERVRLVECDERRRLRPEALDRRSLRTRPSGSSQPASALRWGR